MMAAYHFHLAPVKSGGNREGKTTAFNQLQSWAATFLSSCPTAEFHTAPTPAFIHSLTTYESICFQGYVIPCSIFSALFLSTEWNNIFILLCGIKSSLKDFSTYSGSGCMCSQGLFLVFRNGSILDFFHHWYLTLSSSHSAVSKHTVKGQRKMTNIKIKEIIKNTLGKYETADSSLVQLN